MFLCTPFSSCLFAFSDGNKKGIAKEQDDQINIQDGKNGQQDHQQDVIGFEFEDKECGISGDSAAKETCDEQFRVFVRGMFAAFFVDLFLIFNEHKGVDIDGQEVSSE